MSDPTVAEVVQAINACGELQAHGRRRKVLSAMAAVLAEDEYDEDTLESVLDAIIDTGIALDYGIRVSFPAGTCEGCLMTLPPGCKLCRACRHKRRMAAIKPENEADAARNCPHCNGRGWNYDPEDALRVRCNWCDNGIPHPRIAS